MQKPLSPGSRTFAASLKKSLFKGQRYLKGLQKEEGCWEAEMIWNPMLAAQYVMTARITGRVLSKEYKQGFTRQFRHWQRKDGSWGMHSESEGYLFISVLVYTALRFLGHGKDSPLCQKGRAWILDKGGAISIPTWGKIWLSLVNLYDWSGVHPILPELWLQPAWSPLHPRRFYCHTRLIYLPIGVLYAKKFQAPADALIQALRKEIYLLPYENIRFSKNRNNLCVSDIFAWPTKLTLLAYALSSLANKLIPFWIRKRALKECMRHIRFELHSTRYACISPVNGLLNALVLWIGDSKDRDFTKAFDQTKYWLRKGGREGYRYCGAHSHVWDTSFVLQMAAACPGRVDWRNPAKRAFAFFQKNQIIEDPPRYREFFRESIRGGYCFSDAYHQWPVSDCTAEALLGLERIKAFTGKSLSQDRLILAAYFILKRQNRDGGFGSYEPKRGNWLLELLNPSEMYGNCMLERSYVECTASCVHGLTSFLRLVPGVDENTKKKVNRAISQAMGYLKKAQNQDGSWPGFWGVNYTYGTLFGISALIKGGFSHQHPSIRRAVQWLYQHQLPDGGWGESWKSCLEGGYLPSKQSQIIQTAWALMGLALAGETDGQKVRAALQILMKRQLPNGDFPKEGPTGVFFNTAMLHYMMYKNYFPLWAMALWHKSAT